MAVLPSLPGLEAYVCVSDLPLEEYQNTEEDAEEGGQISKQTLKRTVSMFVEVKTGEEFTVKLFVKPSYEVDSPSLIAKLEIDGVYVGTTAGINKPGENWTRTFRGVLKGEPGQKEALLRPYAFSKIETSECLGPVSQSDIC